MLKRSLFGLFALGFVMLAAAPSSHAATDDLDRSNDLALLACTNTCAADNGCSCPMFFCVHHRCTKR
jgi:hypothetical protein